MNRSLDQSPVDGKRLHLMRKLPKEEALAATGTKVSFDLLRRRQSLRYTRAVDVSVDGDESGATFKTILI